VPLSPAGTACVRDPQNLFIARRARVGFFRGGGFSAFSGKMDTGFPQENATNKGQLERSPIQRNRKTLWLSDDVKPIRSGAVLSDLIQRAARPLAS
jgi:hypothetical protein